MTKAEQLILMVRSEIDSFSNYYPDALNVYFESIQSALVSYDFIKIQFGIEKICEFYETDNSCRFDSLIKLREALQEFNISAKHENLEREKLYKFWISFNSWYEQQKDAISTIFDSSFVYGHDSFGVWIDDGVCCNEDLHYKIEYGEDLVAPTQSSITFQFVKNYVELVYSKYMKAGADGRYPYTKQVNNTFAKFGLPYKLEGGKLKRQNYKTTIQQDKILSYEQFERKISFSEQMILYDDVMDKHTALQYIADAFCYFFSLFKNDGGQISDDKKTIIKIASMVHPDMNEKQYALIKTEIDEVKRIINSDYDIRHNEYYRSEDKTKREVLTDPCLIEYLYNRIYALLYVLRLKYKPKLKLAIDDTDIPL